MTATAPARAWSEKESPAREKRPAKACLRHRFLHQRRSLLPAESPSLHSFVADALRRALPSNNLPRTDEVAASEFPGGCESAVGAGPRSREFFPDAANAVQ